MGRAPVGPNRRKAIRRTRPLEGPLGGRTVSRFESQLQRVDPSFGRLLSDVPLLGHPPLAPDWLRCEMLERYQVLEHAPFGVGDHLLEVGSGAHAIATVPLAFRAGGSGRVVALEPRRWGSSLEILSRVALRARVRPLQGDARHLPLLSDSFDLALCVHGVRSLRSEATMVQVFREMLRVAPKILLAESLPTALNAAQRAHLEMYDLREEYFRATTGALDDLHYLPIERLGQLVANAGGKVLSSEVVVVDLPHFLAFFPRERLLTIPESAQREDLLARWDRADRLRKEHGTDHPPVAVVIAGRTG